MFGLDASKKKINKVWNQRRAASARATKGSTSTGTGGGGSTSKVTATAVSASSSATSSVLSGQQRSASFRYSRPRVDDHTDRRKRSGHSSDLEDDEDEDDLPLGSSSFTRSTRARFKSQQMPHSTSSHTSTGGIAHNTQSTERSINKTNLPPTNVSPVHRAVSGNQESTDLPLSSLVPSSPVTCVPARYSFSLAYDHHHYSNYEWIDADGLTVPPPDPAALACAPCEDVSFNDNCSLCNTTKGHTLHHLFSS